MQGNVIGGNGINLNNSLFPIYQQLAEPFGKSGLWIKNEENTKNIYFQTDNTRKFNKISDLPYNLESGCSIGLNSDVYFFRRKRRFCKKRI